MSDPEDPGITQWSTQYNRHYRQTFTKATGQWETEWLSSASVSQPAGVEATTTPQTSAQHVRAACSPERRNSAVNSVPSLNAGFVSGHGGGATGQPGSGANANSGTSAFLYPVQEYALQQQSNYVDISTPTGVRSQLSNEGIASNYSSNALHPQQQTQPLYAQVHPPSSWHPQHAQNPPAVAYLPEAAVSSAGSSISMPRGKGGHIYGSYTGSKGSSTAEKVDSSFRIRKSNWFADGRVFAVVMNETAGKDATLFHLTNSNKNINPVKWEDNFVHTQIRRFVVVRRKKEFCYACPIYTYGNKGTTKKGVRPKEHGIIYSDGQQPFLVAGEEGITKESICVKMTKGVANLHYASRVYYGIHHPIQHNVKVKDIGQVAQSHMPSLIGNWKAEDDKESAGISGTIAEEAGEASASHPLPNQPDPDAYHPTDNIYGYDENQNPYMYHPTLNPYGYHPTKNKAGYHPQSNSFSYHPEHSPYGYHPQRAPFCYHPAFSPFGYHSVANPIGYHPITMPHNYHPKANEYGYHEDLNPYGYQPALKPGGYHPSVNLGAYHPEYNPGGLHESGSDDDGEVEISYEDDEDGDEDDDDNEEEEIVVQ